MSEIRVLGIQHRSKSPEATVFSTFLSALQHAAEIQPRCAFTVVQFDNETLLAHGEKMRLLPGVDVLSIHIGGSLGTYGPRAEKVVAFGRLLLALPNIIVRSFAFRPDVIYSSQQRWDVRIGTLLSLLLRKPHVIHLHYLPGPWLGKEAFWRLKHCSRIICVSEFIRRLVIDAGVPAQRVGAILNVLPAASLRVDISRDEARQKLCQELQIPASDILVGMTARLNPSKGQRELVQAMLPLLASAESNCQLILAGLEDDLGGTYIHDLLQFAQEKGIAHRVRYLGHRTDVPAMLRAFDVFAHPSFADPCPLAVVEALVAGLPTVVWQEGGAAELVMDGQSGFTVETGNVEALGAALRRLCTDASLRETMRARALADADRLTDTTAAAQQFHDVFANVAKLRAKTLDN